MRRCKIDAHKIYSDDKWVTNGHVAVLKAVAGRLPGKPFAKYMGNGTYFAGSFTNGTCPNIQQVIPNESPVDLEITENARVTNTTNFETVAIELRAKDGSFSVWVSLDFVAILALGREIQAPRPATNRKICTYPVVVKDAGEVLAVIMPIRI